MNNKVWITTCLRLSYIRNILKYRKLAIRHFKDTSKRYEYVEKANLNYYRLSSLASDAGLRVDELPEYKSVEVEMNRVNRKLKLLFNRWKFNGIVKPHSEIIRQYNLRGDIIITDPRYLLKTDMFVGLGRRSNTYCGDWCCCTYEANENRNFRPIKLNNLGTVYSDSGEVCCSVLPSNLGRQYQILREIRGLGTIIRNFNGSIKFRLRTEYSFNEKGEETPIKELNICGAGIKEGKRFSFVTKPDNLQCEITYLRTI